jgi:ribosome biogenesis GTPase YqeH
MNEIKRIRRCPGCGIILQTIDETLPGFVPEKHLLKHEVILCQRCFKIQHYGEDVLSKEPRVDEEFKRILAAAKKQKALIVYVLDLVNFESTLSKDLADQLIGLEIIAVATKRDLLPKVVKDTKLQDYVKERLATVGIKPSTITIASSIKNYNLDILKTAILTTRKTRNVYVIGATSSGKSSLVNAFLKNFANQTHTPITTSPFPGTTLRVIEIPLDSHSFLYDTPGFVIETSLLSKVEKEVIKIVMPKVEIKPRIYQLAAKDALLIGGLARIEVLSGKTTGYTIYLANPITFHKTNLTKADQVMQNMISKRSLKPISRIVTSGNDLEAFEITLEKQKKVDIVIVGYATICVTGFDQVIRVLAPKGVSVIVLPPKI